MALPEKRSPRTHPVSPSTASGAVQPISGGSARDYRRLPIRIGVQGRIVLPQEARQDLGVKPGDEWVLAREGRKLGP